MPPHILLVEDNAFVVGALRMLLEETGHRVSDAATVDAAARALRDDPPDLVLLDLTLGSESGLALLAQSNQDGATRPVVVALTGHDDAETRARCLAAGCRDVLVKPIRALELAPLIAGWLGERVRS